MNKLNDLENARLTMPRKYEATSNHNKAALGTGKACVTFKSEKIEQTPWWAPPELIQSRSFYKYHPAYTKKHHQNPSFQKELSQVISKYDF